MFAWFIKGETMKKAAYILAFLALSAAPLFAQHGTPEGPPITTVSALGHYMVKGKVVAVTDGTSATDCGVGGGSTAVLCQFDGSSWAAIGGTGGANTTLSNLTNPTAINDTTLTFAGAGGLTAGGTNQNITLTPSGTGHVAFDSNAYPNIVSGAQAEYLAYLDGSGTTLHDQSGNGYNCTLGGAVTPTWVLGGGGLGIAYASFGSSYASCPAGMMSGAKTIQVFFAPTVPDTNTNNAGAEFLISDSNTTGIGTKPPNIGLYQLGVYSGGSWADDIGTPLRFSGNSDIAITCTTPASMYYQGSLAPGLFLTYGNGIRTAQNCPTFNGSSTGYIGGASANANFNFSGIVYAVLVYPTVLTAAQIKQNHDAVTALLAQHGVGAFVSPVSPYALIYEGDSRMENAGDAYHSRTSRPYYISRLIPQASQFWNVGVSGSHLSDIAAATHFNNVIYPILNAYPSLGKTILIDASINDIVGGSSAATVYTAAQNYCSTVHSASPSAKIIFSTSTGESALTSGQESARETLNSTVISAMIAGTFNCDGVNDIGNDPIMATQVTPNVYNPSAAGSYNTTWYASGVHETAAANLELSTQEAFSILAGQGRVNQCTVINKQIPYQVVTAANAATPGLTQTVTLLQLFPGWQVCSLSSHVIAGFSGTSISALHMTVGDSGGTATQYQSSVDLTATGTSVAAANTFTSASGVVQMNFTALGANLTALSAGEVDIQIGVIVKP